jgi:hypothetical protein
VRLCVRHQGGGGTGWDAGTGGLGKAIEALWGLESCDSKDKFGLIGWFPLVVLYFLTHPYLH